MPFSINKVTELSRNAIQKAQDIIKDPKLANNEARRIYKSDARGMYKVVQKDARVTMSTCKTHGLTIDKPYKIIDGRMYGVMFGSDILIPYR